jgi:hypothetical protein
MYQQNSTSDRKRVHNKNTIRINLFVKRARDNMLKRDLYAMTELSYWKRRGDEGSIQVDIFTLHHVKYYIIIKVISLYNDKHSY